MAIGAASRGLGRIVEVASGFVGQTTRRYRSGRELALLRRDAPPCWAQLWAASGAVLPRVLPRWRRRSEERRVRDIDWQVHRVVSIDSNAFEKDESGQYRCIAKRRSSWVRVAW
jgi:hypothetical protein